MFSYLKSIFKKTFSGGSPDLDIRKAGNPDVPNILIFTEHVNATYYICFDIPLGELHKNGKINFAVASQGLVKQAGPDCWRSWHTTFRPDVVVMTRYGLPYGKDILDYFKKTGVPVIYHIDDNLLEIPHSLGAEIQKVQGAGHVIDERRYLLENADFIYTSTQHLANYLKSLFPHQELYCGMHTPYMGEHMNIPPRGHDREQVFGYMGSKGHSQDLKLVIPAISRLLDENPNLRFEVFGTIQMPEELKRFGDRVHSHRVNQSYTGFLKTLAGLNWELGIAPLANEPFNLCKSATKFVEYTAAGIPVVASDIAVYSLVIPEGGGVLVKDNWFDPITRLLNDETHRAETLKTARYFCSTHFSEATLQHQLQGVVAKALKKPAV